MPMTTPCENVKIPAVQLFLSIQSVLLVLVFNNEMTKSRIASVQNPEVPTIPNLPASAISHMHSHIRATKEKR